MKRIKLKSIISLVVSLLVMIMYVAVESMIIFGFSEPSYRNALFGYVCVWLFSIPFFSFVFDFLRVVNKNEKTLLKEVLRKNLYLEHASKILRHDMHSGINTYLPRGVRSLERRLDKETIKELKLESTIKLIKEGLTHAQVVYAGVKEFTDLARDDVKLKKEKHDLCEILKVFMKRTSYCDQVIIEPLVRCNVNVPLFCTAIDNLVRNGLKYNDSKTKVVRIYMIDENTIGVEDNGRGMSGEQFVELSKPYIRGKQREPGTGLGLNICLAILHEHDFIVDCEKIETGTLIKICLSKYNKSHTGTMVVSYKKEEFDNVTNQ